MARIKETFDSRAWFRLECDDHNCEQRINDWYAYEDDLLFDAKDDGWQILYRDEHPRIGTRHALLPGAPAARMLDLHEHHDRSGRLEGRAMPRMHQGGDPD